MDDARANPRARQSPARPGDRASHGNSRRSRGQSWQGLRRRGPREGERPRSRASGQGVKPSPRSRRQTLSGPLSLEDRTGPGKTGLEPESVKLSALATRRMPAGPSSRSSARHDQPRATHGEARHERSPGELGGELGERSDGGPQRGHAGASEARSSGPPSAGQRARGSRRAVTLGVGSRSTSASKVRPVELETANGSSRRSAFVRGAVSVLNAT